MPPIGLTRIAEHGVDLTGQLSVSVIAHVVPDADIVRGITREYVGEIIAVSLDAWHKTFALTDLIHRREQPCRGRRRRHQSISDWLDSIGTGRDRQDVVRADPAEGVPNPFGQRTRLWDHVIDKTDDLVSRTIPTLGVQGRRCGVMHLTIDAIADVANPSDKVIASANRLIGAFEMAGRMVSTRQGLRNIV